MNLHRFVLALFLAVGCTIYAQVKEVNPPDFIKTITFKSNTTQGQLPILKLGEPLELEFDALNAYEEDFYYVIEYFNYDWTPSVLVKAEYLRGIDNQRILEYYNSFNTYQVYSHYKLRIPNIQTRGLLKSGNYMISIYDDYDELIFSRKFMIYEDIAGVGVQVRRSRDVAFVDERQTVDIKIVSGRISLNNPLETVRTLIIQNNNLNTAIANLKPQYTIGQELIYRYTNKTAFNGGNEYLFFENKNVRAANVGVQFIDLQDIYHNYLFTQLPRQGRPYTYNPDINGNFKITAVDRENLDIEADYTMIHFSLKHPELMDKNIHVYGNFNAFAIEDLTKMEFNPETGNYETMLRLKQGFYNYKFVVVDKITGELDEGAISGNYWQTENNYKVLVYYRDLGARYDRIIGFGEATSIDIAN